jgi:hypothetical protein
MIYFHEVTDTNTDLTYRINLGQISRYVEEDDFAVVWMSDGEQITVNDVEWSDIKPIIAKIQKQSERQLGHV